MTDSAVVALLQGGPRREDRRDGAGQGRTPPGEPRALRLQPRIASGLGPVPACRHPSHPKSTTTTMASATTATARLRTVGKRRDRQILAAPHGPLAAHPVVDRAQ